MSFDKLILLHEGYQLYQGPINEVTPYLNSLSIKLNRYQNIADFVIKMAQAPHLVRFNLNNDELKTSYATNIAPKI